MISDKVITEVSPAGEISKVTWKPRHLRRMLLPEKSLVKIPNPKWEILEFPFNLMEDVINASAARITFKIHVPAYPTEKAQIIAQTLQKIVYDDGSSEAELHKRAALKTIIQNVSKKSPQLFLAGDVISISSYTEGYFNAVRFTPWSMIPAELQQIRIVWDEDTNLLNRINEVQVELLFNQQMIDQNFTMRINRRGILDFPMKNWTYNFDLDKVRNREIPVLDKLQTPPMEHVISSDTSPENEKPRPKKRIRLMNRFAVSSDEE